MTTRILIFYVVFGLGAAGLILAVLRRRQYPRGSDAYATRDAASLICLGIVLAFGPRASDADQPHPATTVVALWLGAIGTIRWVISRRLGKRTAI